MNVDFEDGSRSHDARGSRKVTSVRRYSSPQAFEVKSFEVSTLHLLLVAIPAPMLPGHGDDIVPTMHTACDAPKEVLQQCARLQRGGCSAQWLAK